MHFVRSLQVFCRYNDIIQKHAVRQDYTSYGYKLKFTKIPVFSHCKKTFPLVASTCFI